MANVRTRNSPGVEIRAIDKSQASPAIVGTGVLVMGYANKGESYNPLDIVSVQDFETNFGTPTNEAERYFYYAAKDVILEQGNLIAAKIPYGNVMDSAYKYVSVDVDTAGEITDLSALQADLPEISTALEDLSGSTTITSWMKVDASTQKSISVSNYDTLVAGGGYASESDEFMIVMEKKNKKTGAKFNEGTFVTVVDPIHGMLVQRALVGTDSDPMKIVTQDGELSASTFIDNLSAAYNSTSISETMMNYFPTVDFVNGGSDFSNEYNKWVTVIVSTTQANANQNGDLDVVIQEAWTGSLRSIEKDTSTGASVYIGDIINGNSEYITWYATSPDDMPLTTYRRCSVHQRC
jgi:hypothetical protein